MAGEGLSVDVACRALGVSRSGFYVWRQQRLSARAVRRAWLTDQIREVHAASFGVYVGRGESMPSSCLVAASTSAA